MPDYSPLFRVISGMGTTQTGTPTSTSSGWRSGYGASAGSGGGYGASTGSGGVGYGSSGWGASANNDSPVGNPPSGRDLQDAGGGAVLGWIMKNVPDLGNKWMTEQDPKKKQELWDAMVEMYNRQSGNYYGPTRRGEGGRSGGVRSLRGGSGPVGAILPWGGRA
jgi:ABC-type transport system substrate-binding protein